MRVIAGSAKGVRLVRVPPGVRPVSDRAREGLFSSLGAGVEGARVLDLFSGTGAMGIEALSRGAQHATLVEHAGPALTALRLNLARAAVDDRAQVVASDVASFLRRNDKRGAPYDLVLADPPYELGSPELDEVLAQLGRGWLHSNGWTVVLTRAKQSSMPVIPVDWVLARRLGYGDSLVTLYRPDPSAQSREDQ
ncbi:MAG TPA: 16S rRNA (guanine(966)-N(2))-methyltransferase RsmD [Actinomycetota bacterium]|nr:16S rRNA (guanine(966)-N(2))-methyltransferase RsmD [Actinomycetota bacterium]